MLRFLCILLTVAIIFCGCTTDPQRDNFKVFRHPKTSEIKIHYTYKEALHLAEDSNGFYNFFLLPGISPDQANAFEEKLAAESGLGYTVYSGAHPRSVDVLVRTDVPVELLEAYIETLVAHRKADRITKYSTFRAAITYYMTLRKAMQMPANSKTWSPDIQADAEHILLGLLLMLEDDRANSEDYIIDNAWRTLDRVKFHMYKKKMYEKRQEEH